MLVCAGVLQRVHVTRPVQRQSLEVVICVTHALASVTVDTTLSVDAVTSAGTATGTSTARPVGLFAGLFNGLSVLHSDVVLKAIPWPRGTSRLGLEEPRRQILWP